MTASLLTVTMQARRSLHFLHPLTLVCASAVGGSQKTMVISRVPFHLWTQRWPSNKHGKR